MERNMGIHPVPETDLDPIVNGANYRASNLGYTKAW